MNLLQDRVLKAIDEFKKRENKDIFALKSIYRLLPEYKPRTIKIEVDKLVKDEKVEMVVMEPVLFMLKEDYERRLKKLDNEKLQKSSNEKTYGYRLSNDKLKETFPWWFLLIALLIAIIINKITSA